jgi:chromosome segregation ATPase
MLRALSLCLILALPLCAADAPAAGAADARLRDTLRNTLLQLRTAEAERATAQAAQAEAEEKNKQLAAKLVEDAKAAAAEKEALEKTGADLHAKLTASEAQAADLKTQLEKWKADNQKITAIAQKTESARAKLASEKIVLERQVADQKTKNLALFKTGIEILARFEKFSFGEALASREPFIGTTRVKLQTFIQDSHDQLEDQRIKSGKPAPADSGAR